MYISVATTIGILVAPFGGEKVVVDTWAEVELSCRDDLYQMILHQVGVCGGIC